MQQPDEFEEEEHHGCSHRSQRGLAQRSAQEHAGIGPAQQGKRPRSLGKSAEEHETEDKVIVDEEGKIVSIKEKEMEEEKVEVEVEMNEVIETFAKALETLNNEISELRKSNEEMNNKLNKFSAEPAGDKIYDRKGYSEYMEEQKFSKLERLAELRRTIK